jgi:hypothetical protein
VTTIRVPSRPRSGGRAPWAVAELALPALTVVVGLQLLRLMVSTVVSVQRDRLGAPLASLALFAFAVVGLGLLAAPAARLLGRRRILVASAAGVAVVRLVLQLVGDPLARWLLAPVGVVLFLWFVPAWLARGSGGGGFALAVLVGLATDTALVGLGGSWDYAWSSAGWAVVLAGLLAGAALWALAALPDPDPGPPGRPGRRWTEVLPLAGVGPALFLHALAWQNLGWQAVLGGRSQAQAFLLVMAANLAALAAGTAAAVAAEVRWPVAGTALAGLAVAIALGQEATAAAGVLGQAATAVLLVVVVRRVTGPAGPEGEGGGAGLGMVAAAWTAGMLLFVLLVFGYYAAYDLVLPVGNGPIPALAAALVGLAGVLAMPGGRRQGPARRPSRRDLVPSGAGAALLVAPLLFWATAPDPVAAAPGHGAGPARPVRVLSWNLHFGFDLRGWSGLDGAARAIEASGAEVVGLQEISRGWYVNGSTDMLAWLQRRLRMPHARFAGASDAIWGNAVLSRYPILADQVVRLPREGVLLRRNALGVELDLGAGRRLRVVVTHLHHLQGPDGTRVRLAQLPRLLEGVAGRPTRAPGRRTGRTGASTTSGSRATWPPAGSPPPAAPPATTAASRSRSGDGVASALGRPSIGPDRPAGPVGLVALGEDGVEAAAGVVQDLQRPGLLGLGAGAGHAPGGLVDLADGGPEAPGDRGHAGGDRLPWRPLLLALHLGPSGVGEREPAAALALLTGDQALVLEQLEGRVDRPRARPPDAAGARLQLLDHLVAVHGPLGQQGQDRGPDVAAAAPPPPVAAEAPRPGRPGQRRPGRAERPEGPVMSHPVLVVSVSVHVAASSHRASPPAQRYIVECRRCNVWLMASMRDWLEGWDRSRAAMPRGRGAACSARRNRTSTWIMPGP